MRPRNPEAARLQADYIDRLKRAMSGRDPEEIAEIVQSVQEHVDEALVEYGEGEVTLVQMAQVLERLGPPESYAHEEAAGAARQTPPPPQTAPPPSSAAQPPPRQPSREEQESFALMLDKVWWAYLVSVAGLYVPLIDFHFCDIIGYGILAVVLLRYAGFGESELRGAGRLALTTAILLVVMVPLAVATLLLPVVGILALPVAIGMIAISLIAYWKVMGVIASFARRNGHVQIAASVLTARMLYIFGYMCLFALTFAVGLVAGMACGVKNAAQLWWVGLVMLPVGWLIGGLLVLRPIARAREALRAGGC